MKPYLVQLVGSLGTTGQVIISAASLEDARMQAFKNYGVHVGAVKRLSYAELERIRFGEFGK